MSQSTTNDKSVLSTYHDELKKHSLGPLWEDLGYMVTKEPVHEVEPYLWKWQTIRDYVLKAGELLEPGKDAERRVVYLQNPSLLKQGLVGYGTNTLYAGIQLLLPGETAPPHSHSQTAIRFIIEGEGAYTAVNGEKTYMKRGDMILTPSWTWHEHGHEGTEPMFWMDGLDVGLVRNLAASFMKPSDVETHIADKPDNYSERQFSSGAFRPVNDEIKTGYPSPLIGYKWPKAKETLQNMSELTPDPIEANASDGYAIEYINPTTGRAADSRIGTMMQKIPPQQHMRAHRHVHSAIYHVLEGNGYTVIDGQKFEWSKGDFFILPPWSWHEHVNEGAEDAYLFSFNDKPVLEALELEDEEQHPSETGYQEIEKVFDPDQEL